MRFLLDENVSYRVCPHLKAVGHDAVHVSEIGLTSTDGRFPCDLAQRNVRPWRCHGCTVTVLMCRPPATRRRRGR